MRIHNSKWQTNLRQTYYLSGGNMLPSSPPRGPLAAHTGLPGIIAATWAQAHIP